MWASAWGHQVVTCVLRVTLCMRVDQIIREVLLLSILPRAASTHSQGTNHTQHAAEEAVVNSQPSEEIAFQFVTSFEAGPALHDGLGQELPDPLQKLCRKQISTIEIQLAARF